MLKNLALMLACIALGSIYSFNVQAFPLSAVPAQATGSDITLVAGGCGLGFHRGPYGYCVRNGAPYVYGPAVVAPPVVVAPPFAVAPAVCPYGYRMGPYGRCYPY